MNKNRNFQKCRITAAVLAVLLLVSFSNAQKQRSLKAFNDTSSVAMSCPDTVLLDTTVAVGLWALNKGREVVAATVNLVDSTSGDTLTNWYPILAQQSFDSTLAFWNTKGTKPGRHVLKVFLTSQGDSAVGREVKTFVVTIKR
jgi:hypothetical protein